MIFIINQPDQQKAVTAFCKKYFTECYFTSTLDQNYNLNTIALAKKVLIWNKSFNHTYEERLMVNLALKLEKQILSKKCEMSFDKNKV